MKKLLTVVLCLIVLAGITNAQKKGQMKAGANVVVALPLGDFGDAAKTGFGGTFNFLFTIANNIDLTGSVGYLTFGRADVGGVSVDGSTHTIPILFGGRYYIGKAKSKILPYAGAELGFHISGGSDITVSQTFAGQTFKQTVSQESSTDFGFGFGGGTLVALNKKTNLDFTVQYNIISTTGSSSGYITIEAGANFAIN